jgi:hypothetical protein
MKKCIGIDAKKWAAAKTPEERQALIDASHIDLTPAEIAQREEDERQHQIYAGQMAETEYKRQRAAEFMPIGDQLDAVMRGFSALRGQIALPAETSAWIDHCIAVKAKYPKPKAS